MRPGVSLTCFTIKLYAGIFAVDHVYRKKVRRLSGSNVNKWFF